MMKLDGKVITFPIMVDMRRYLKDKSFNSLSNLSSTVMVSITVNRGESFTETLRKVHNEMNIKKEKNIGLNGFIKLAMIFKIFSSKKACELLKNNLKNPYICLTNVGVLDSNKLIFKGSEISNAMVCGSIKYRPHFQMAFSSFREQLTLSVNLYGSKQDRNIITNYFSLVDKELPR